MAPMLVSERRGQEYRPRRHQGEDHVGVKVNRTAMIEGIEVALDVLAIDRREAGGGAGLQLGNREGGVVDGAGEDNRQWRLPIEEPAVVMNDPAKALV